MFQIAVKYKGEQYPYMLVFKEEERARETYRDLVSLTSRESGSQSFVDDFGRSQNFSGKDIVVIVCSDIEAEMKMQQQLEELQKKVKPTYSDNMNKGLTAISGEGLPEYIRNGH